MSAVFQTEKRVKKKVRQLSKKQAALAPLRVKIRSLADEARVIRHYEDRTRFQPDAHNSLHRHRVVVVARAVRDALLALAFLRGMDYSRVEASTRQPPKRW